MSTTKVAAPEMTPEERRLLQEQTATLSQQRQTVEEQQSIQNLLMPLLLQSQGFIPEMDENGKIIGFSQDPGRAEGEAAQRQGQLELQNQQLTLGKAELDQLIANQPALAELLQQQITGQGTQNEISNVNLQTLLDLQPQLKEITQGQVENQGIQTELLQGQLETFQSNQPILDELFGKQAGVAGQQADELSFQLDELLNNRDPAQAGLRSDINTQLLERTLSALEGNIDVSPTLTRGLDEERTRLVDRLRQQLGTGFETSTPGIEALNMFDLRAQELKENERRGMITDFQNLNIQAKGSQDNTLAALLGTRTAGAPSIPTGGFSSPGSLDSILAAGGTSTFNAPQFGGLQFANPNASGNAANFAQMGLATAQGFGGTAAGFSNPLSLLQGDRNMQLQADIQNSQASGMLGSMLGGVLGQSLGTVSGAFAADKLGLGG